MGGIVESGTLMALAAIAGATATVYSATQKPKLPNAPKLPEGAKLDKAADTAPLSAQRARSRAAAAAGRAGTIRTSPLGLPPSGNTILGG